MGSIPATLVISITYKHKHVSKTKRKKSFLTKRKKPSNSLVRPIKRTLRILTTPLASSVVSRLPRLIPRTHSFYNRPKRLKIRLNRVTRFSKINALNRVPYLQAFSKSKSIFFSFQKMSCYPPLVNNELNLSLVPTLSL